MIVRCCAANEQEQYHERLLQNPFLVRTLTPRLGRMDPAPALFLYTGNFYNHTTKTNKWRCEEFCRRLAYHKSLD